MTLTKCFRCNKILTNKKGKRIRNAVFDSSLPNQLTEQQKKDFKVTWARCQECWQKETKNKLKLSNIELAQLRLLETILYRYTHYIEKCGSE